MTKLLGGAYVVDIAAHIPFYYVESRLCYLREVLRNLSLIPHSIHVFIYSNKKIDLDFSCNGLKVKIIEVKFFESPLFKKSFYGHFPIFLRRYFDPFFLTWENRRYIEKTINKYDVQIYLEDDICFSNASFEYWLRYKDKCIKHGYNLGFLRFEVGYDGTLYCTDLTKNPDKIINIDGNVFLVNDNNPYCGFWIYDKSELFKFIRSKEWKFKFNDYEIRERSAIGWNGLKMKRYKGTVIPLMLQDYDTWLSHNDCRVHHLPNNYIGHPVFCTVKFPVEIKIHNQNTLLNS